MLNKVVIFCKTATNIYQLNGFCDRKDVLGKENVDFLVADRKFMASRLYHSKLIEQNMNEYINN